MEAADSMHILMEISTKMWKRYLIKIICPPRWQSSIQDKIFPPSLCKPGHLCPEIYKALDGILFIAEHKKSQEESNKVIFWKILHLQKWNKIKLFDY